MHAYIHTYIQLYVPFYVLCIFALIYTSYNVMYVYT